MRNVKIRGTDTCTQISTTIMQQINSTAERTNNYQRTNLVGPVDLNELLFGFWQVVLIRVPAVDVHASNYIHSCIYI